MVDETVLEFEELIRAPLLPALDQWIEFEYRLDDLFETPLSDIPFQVHSTNDPEILITGSTDFTGKARVVGLLPGIVAIDFFPENVQLHYRKAYIIREELQSLIQSLSTRTASVSAQVYNRWRLQIPAASDALISGDTKTVQEQLNVLVSSEPAFLEVNTLLSEALFFIFTDQDLLEVIQRISHWNESLPYALLAFSIATFSESPYAAHLKQLLLADFGELCQPMQTQLKELHESLKPLKAKQRVSGRTQHNERYHLSGSRPSHYDKQDLGGTTTQAGHNERGRACPIMSATPITDTGVCLITGELLLSITDFTLKQRIPVLWQRVYRSSCCRNRGLGVGWTFPFNETMQLGKDVVVLSLADGRQISFPIPDCGQTVVHQRDGMLLYRQWYSVFIFKQAGQPDKLFMGKDTLKLSTVTDCAGNQWRCVYNPDTQVLARLVSSWGTELYFVAHQKGLIDSILISTPKDPVPQLLVRYYYSPSGDLIRIDKHDGSHEIYGYRNRFMVQRYASHEALIEYDWEESTHQVSGLRQAGNGDSRFYWDQEARRNRWLHNNTETQIAYNEFGQVTQWMRADGRCFDYQYNGLGLMTQVRDGQEYETRYSYDKWGQLVNALDPAAGGFTILYNEARYPSLLSDSEGQPWIIDYNAAGLIVKITDPEVNTTHFFYDETGSLQALSDELGTITGKDLRQHPFGSVTSLFQRPGNGIFEFPAQLAQPTQCDPLGRPLILQLDTADLVHYQYDGNGRLTSAISRLASLAFSYSPNGCLQAEIQGNLRFDHEYNARGQRTKTTLGQQSVDYHYNPAGQLNGIGYNGCLLVSIEHDPQQQYYEIIPKVSATKVPFTENNYPEIIRQPVKDQATYDGLGRPIKSSQVIGTPDYFWDQSRLFCERRKDAHGNHTYRLYLNDPQVHQPLGYIENNRVYFYEFRDGSTVSSSETFLNGDVATLRNYHFEQYGIHRWMQWFNGQQCEEWVIRSC